MNSPIGMHAQDSTERAKFEDELWRILEASESAGLTLRVIGSLAFQIHCSEYGYLQQAMGRAYTDIDFAGYSEECQRIKGLMESLGYVENQRVTLFSEGSRAIFDNRDLDLYVDVFYDQLDFCHEISWEGRLHIDSPTIPLAEMLLEKMQIVKINEKDVIDTIMLLLEHPLGDDDAEMINTGRVARLCSQDWGLWRTTTMNLEKVRQLAQHYDQLTEEQKAVVTTKVEGVLTRLEEEPKSLAWRLRSRVGDRLKWYKEVDEV